MPKIGHLIKYQNDLFDQELIDLFFDKFYLKNDNLDEYCIHHLVVIIYKIHMFITPEKMNKIFLLIKNKKINISDYQKSALRIFYSSVIFIEQ